MATNSSSLKVLVRKRCCFAPTVAAADHVQVKRLQHTTSASHGELPPQCPSQRCGQSLVIRSSEAAPRPGRKEATKLIGTRMPGLLQRSPSCTCCATWQRSCICQGNSHWRRADKSSLPPCRPASVVVRVHAGTACAARGPQLRDGAPGAGRPSGLRVAPPASATVSMTDDSSYEYAP